MEGSIKVGSASVEDHVAAQGVDQDDDQQGLHDIHPPLGDDLDRDLDQGAYFALPHPHQLAAGELYSQGALVAWVYPQFANHFQSQ